MRSAPLWLSLALVRGKPSKCEALFTNSQCRYQVAYKRHHAFLCSRAGNRKAWCFLELHNHQNAAGFKCTTSSQPPFHALLKRQIVSSRGGSSNSSSSVWRSIPQCSSNALHTVTKVVTAPSSCTSAARLQSTEPQRIEQPTVTIESCKRTDINVPDCAHPGTVILRSLVHSEPSQFSVYQHASFISPETSKNYFLSRISPIIRASSSRSVVAPLTHPLSLAYPATNSTWLSQPYSHQSSPLRGSTRSFKTLTFPDFLPHRKTPKQEQANSTVEVAEVNISIHPENDPAATEGVPDTTPMIQEQVDSVGGLGADIESAGIQKKLDLEAALALAAEGRYDLEQFSKIHKLMSSNVDSVPLESLWLLFFHGANMFGTESEETRKCSRLLCRALPKRTVLESLVALSTVPPDVLSFVDTTLLRSLGQNLSNGRTWSDAAAAARIIDMFNEASEQLTAAFVRIVNGLCEGNQTKVPAEVFEILSIFCKPSLDGMQKAYIRKIVLTFRRRLFTLDQNQLSELIFAAGQARVLNESEILPRLITAASRHFPNFPMPAVAALSKAAAERQVPLFPECSSALTKHLLEWPLIDTDTPAEYLVCHLEAMAAAFPPGSLGPYPRPQEQVNQDLERAGNVVKSVLLSIEPRIRELDASQLERTLLACLSMKKEDTRVLTELVSLALAALFKPSDKRHAHSLVERMVAARHPLPYATRPIVNACGAVLISQVSRLTSAELIDLVDLFHRAGGAPVSLINRMDTELSARRSELPLDTQLTVTMHLSDLKLLNGLLLSHLKLAYASWWDTYLADTLAEAPDEPEAAPLYAETPDPVPDFFPIPRSDPSAVAKQILQPFQLLQQLDILCHLQPDESPPLQAAMQGRVRAALWHVLPNMQSGELVRVLEALVRLKLVPEAMVARVAKLLAESLEPIKDVWLPIESLRQLLNALSYLPVKLLLEPTIVQTIKACARQLDRTVRYESHLVFKGWHSRAYSELHQQVATVQFRLVKLRSSIDERSSGGHRRAERSAGDEDKDDAHKQVEGLETAESLSGNGAHGQERNVVVTNERGNTARPSSVHSDQMASSNGQGISDQRRQSDQGIGVGDAGTSHVSERSDRELRGRDQAPHESEKKRSGGGSRTAEATAEKLAQAIRVLRPVELILAARGFVERGTLHGLNPLDKSPEMLLEEARRHMAEFSIDQRVTLLTTLSRLMPSIPEASRLQAVVQAAVSGWWSKDGWGSKPTIRNIIDMMSVCAAIKYYNEEFMKGGCAALLGQWRKHDIIRPVNPPGYLADFLEACIALKHGSGRLIRAISRTVALTAETCDPGMKEMILTNYQRLEKLVGHLKP